MSSVRSVCEADVGQGYWLGEDGHVWQVVGYCRYPTVTFARVDDPTVRRGGAVGAPIVSGFVQLVPESTVSTELPTA